jgi:transcriptional regulator GlxA family with amidase domain
VDGTILSWHFLAIMPKSPQIPPISHSHLEPKAIEVVAFDGVQLLDVMGPIQVFATANETIAKAGGSQPYKIRIVAGRTPSVTASAGIVFATEYLPLPGIPVDTLIAAGGPGVQAAAQESELVCWLRNRAQEARRIASVCTGAYLLGATGMLDGRCAVTHWSYCDDFARCFPAVRVEADPIFLRDGPVWTSAGVTAGIDLALALVEEDLGRDVALAVARHLVVFLKRPGGQAQFSAALALQSGEPMFGPLHAWINANLNRDLSLPVLSAKAGMSERSFSRHYLKATGLTPARAVERLRVEAARRLLLDTKLPVKRVAQQCGFGTEETMRRSFLRLLSAAPGEYRERFSPP